MRTVYFTKKLTKQIRNDQGVYECYVCGALTDRCEADVTLCREGQYDSKDPSFERTAHEQDVKFVRAVCPNESEQWHKRIKKLLDIFNKYFFYNKEGKDLPEKLKEKVIARIREIQKNSDGGIRFNITNKKQTLPVERASKTFWNSLHWEEVMYQVHGRKIRPGNPYHKEK